MDEIMDSEPTMPGALSESDQIASLDFDLDLKSMYFNFPCHLVFVEPRPTVVYRHKVLETDLSNSNTGAHSLDVRDAASLAVIHYEDFLCEVLLNMGVRSHLVNSSAERSWMALKLKALQELRRLDRLKGKEWEAQRYLHLNSATFVRSGPHMFPLFSFMVLTIY